MLQKESISDNLIRWDNYVSSDGVVCHFTEDDWASIAGSIDSEEEWSTFLQDNSHYFRCFTLRRISDGEAIAMVYLVNEDLKWGKVSIHGGGWCTNPSFLFRGYAVMIERLLSLGVKVQTHTSLSNTKAIRFNRAIGFVPYRHIDDAVYMYITHKTLAMSRVYTWLYGERKIDGR